MKKQLLTVALLLSTNPAVQAINGPEIWIPSIQSTPEHFVPRPENAKEGTIYINTDPGGASQEYRYEKGKWLYLGGSHGRPEMTVDTWKISPQNKGKYLSSEIPKQEVKHRHMK